MFGGFFGDGVRAKSLFARKMDRVGFCDYIAGKGRAINAAAQIAVAINELDRIASEIGNSTTCARAFH